MVQNSFNLGELKIYGECWCLISEIQLGCHHLEFFSSVPALALFG